MDPRFRAFAWILGSGCFGAALGTVFGAVAGVCYWRSGHASGTRIGLRVAETFRRLAGRDLSHATCGGLVGAVDGFLFLGMVGTFVGAFAVYGGWEPAETIRSALFVTLFLVGGATFFGVLAYSLTRAGVRALAAVGLCGILGAGIGSITAGIGGVLFGAIAGVVVGNAIGLLWPAGRYTPGFSEPVIKMESRVLPSAGGDGIQGQPGIETVPE
jgi:hypothetical protein